MGISWQTKRISFTRRRGERSSSDRGLPLHLPFVVPLLTCFAWPQKENRPQRSPSRRRRSARTAGALFRHAPSLKRIVSKAHPQPGRLVDGHKGHTHARNAGIDDTSQNVLCRSYDIKKLQKK